MDPTELRFLPKTSSFAATVLLRFISKDVGSESKDALCAAVLEFHDPLRNCNASPQPGALPLAADLTAPLAKIIQDNPRTYLAGFVQSGTEYQQSRLTFLEPYQVGKTPIVFIHGLYSDPQSWADMENDLRAIPGFCDRFQVWFFRYPTGQGFLRSAAELRSELQAAIQACDPDCADPELRQMILVGHSMGGLIAKLQITHSENHIWRRLANRPLKDIKIDQTARAKLAAACFFEPALHVRRVIFIATPHHGANEASGVVGNIASRFVRESPEDSALHRQLIAQNPGVFSDIVQQRLPTSIDLLKPNSPLLTAMQEMKIGSGVEYHNILGEIPFPSLQGPSDGVVPIASASHDGFTSEIIVSEAHAKVHRSQETIKEVARILLEHQ
jgi:pimeloyl-ACP methyl ester carboxylesterase